MMSDEQALIPVEQKQVEFYGDTIIAVRAKEGAIYVPVRPICELMGLDWSSQRQRIARDPVSVSYTHLTMPTSDLVEISVGGGS